jgi:hypothetical protein
MNISFLVNREGVEIVLDFAPAGGISRLNRRLWPGKEKPHPQKGVELVEKSR